MFPLTLGSWLPSDIVVDVEEKDGDDSLLLLLSLWLRSGDCDWTVGVVIFENKQESLTTEVV